MQTACWWGAPAPAESLLLAAGLVSPNCDRPLGVTASLTGASSLVVTVDHGSTCHGASTSSSPLLSLLAVPLADLPPLLLDVRLVHRGDPLSGAATQVDLRRPLDQPSDPIALAQRVREGYVNAAADAGSRLGVGGLVPASIAVRRWDDASAGCPASGKKYDHKPVHGYAIRMISATDPRHPVVEYHGDPAALVYCGVTATASPSPTPK